MIVAIIILLPSMILFKVWRSKVKPTAPVPEGELRLKVNLIFDFFFNEQGIIYLVVFRKMLTPLGKGFSEIPELE